MCVPDIIAVQFLVTYNETSKAHKIIIAKVELTVLP
jgi:hypothetical protein